MSKRYMDVRRCRELLGGEGAGFEFLKIARRAIVATLIASLSACGGGGGGGAPSASTGASPAPQVSTFTSVALVGELLTYTADTANLTYSYTITDSQYGLTGKTASGTLARNSDGTYSPSGVSNATIAILPNGLMLGAIEETLNGTPSVIPIIGMSDPIKDVASMAGTYNFVQRSCIDTVCQTGYGTFQLSPASTWILCPSGDLTGGCPQNAISGTLKAVGAGKWQMMVGSSVVGTAIGFNSNGQTTVVWDLTDNQPGGLGVGLLLGSSQQPMETSNTDGTWLAATTTGQWARFSALGSQISYKSLNGAPYSSTSTFTPNAPWTGMGTAIGGSVLFAGTGVYIYENSGGYAEIGVKVAASGSPASAGTAASGGTTTASIAATTATPSGTATQSGTTTASSSTTTSTSTTAPAAVTVPVKFNPGHYVMVYPSTSTTVMGNDLARNPLFRGVGKEYDWNTLETSRGVYDFSAIERDLNYLNSLNKKLIVVVRPNAFAEGEKHVPDYITGPEFGGGVYVIRYTNYAGTVITTNGPVLWNANVRDRLIALMRALARFDTHPALEAIQVVDESAVKTLDTSLNPGVEPFDLRAYTDNLTMLATETRKVFVNTQTLLGFNYPSGMTPDALSIWASAAQASGFGIQAPDVLLKVPSLTRYSYTYFPKLSGVVPLHATVDWMDYESATIADIYAYARDNLRATHIRWQERNDAPAKYFDQVVSFMNSMSAQNVSGGLNSGCPSAYTSCKN